MNDMTTEKGRMEAASRPEEPSVAASSAANSANTGNSGTSGASASPVTPGAAPQLRERRFPTVGDVLAMLGIALGAQIIVSVLAMLVLLVAGYGTDLTSLAPQALGRLQAGLYFISMSAALAGVLYYRRVRGGRGRWAGFALRGFNPALLLWAFVLIFAVGVVLEPLLRLLPDVKMDVGRGGWTILMLVVFAPIFEELLCRGVVLGSLRARYGVTVAWLVSSLFFGVLHVQPAQVVSASVIGLILGFVYLSTESLWSVMILHALNNAVAYLMLMAGYGNTLLIEMIDNRTLYVLIYIVALALTAISGYMMARTLRKMKSAEKSDARPGDKNPATA